MHSELATETLKTGEEMRVECVLAPDAERAAQIVPFLGHKNSFYRAHIETALAGQCDALETRFYIGLLGEQVVGNIMTVEAGGVGILGHVHTRQDRRRQGICSAIMGHQMADFDRRGGHVLLLGTGFQSPPYWIYHRFGFRDWKEGRPGWMRYADPQDPDFETRFFASAPTRAVAARWSHWPLVALLASVPGTDYLRSLTFNLWGVGLLEGTYCRFLCESGERTQARAAVLESMTGAVVGIATCVPDSRWRGDVQLLDLFAHPNVEPADLAELLRALPLPEGRTQCYADPCNAEKIAALEATGFRREAILPRQFCEQEVWSDVWLYAR